MVENIIYSSVQCVTNTTSSVLVPLLLVYNKVTDRVDGSADDYDGEFF